jgi:DNA repair exonuclease SbcCD ATPase subunit
MGLDMATNFINLTNDQPDDVFLACTRKDDALTWYWINNESQKEQYIDFLSGFKFDGEEMEKEKQVQVKPNTMTIIQYATIKYSIFITDDFQVKFLKLSMGDATFVFNKETAEWEQYPWWKWIDEPRFGVDSIDVILKHNLLGNNFQKRDETRSEFVYRMCNTKIVNDDSIAILKQLEDLKNENDAKNAKMERDLEEANKKNAEIQAELDKAKSNVDQAGNQLGQLQIQMETNASAKANLELELAKIRQQMETNAQARNVNASKATELTEELEKIKKEKAALEEQAVELNATLDEEKTKLAAAESELAELRKMTTTTATDILSITKKAEELEATLKDKDAELDELRRANGEQLERLQKQDIDQQQQAVVLSETVEREKQLVDDLKGQLEINKAALDANAELSKQLENETNAHAIQTNEATDRENELKIQLEKLQGQLDDANDDANKANEALLEARKNRDGNLLLMKQRLTASENQVSALEKSLDEARLASLRSNFEMITEQIKDYAIKNGKKGKTGKDGKPGKPSKYAELTQEDFYDYAKMFTDANLLFKEIRPIIKNIANKPQGK